MLAFASGLGLRVLKIGFRILVNARPMHSAWPCRLLEVVHATSNHLASQSVREFIPSHGLSTTSCARAVHVRNYRH